MTGVGLEIMDAAMGGYIETYDCFGAMAAANFAMRSGSIPSMVVALLGLRGDLGGPVEALGVLVSLSDGVTVTADMVDVDMELMGVKVAGCGALKSSSSPAAPRLLGSAFR